jgi:hypothetical protein
MFKKVLWIIVLIGIALFSGLMFTKIYPYFLPEHPLMFWSTKTDAVNANAVFHWSFYIHIVSSFVVMLAGMLSFIPVKFIQKRHGLCGKIYVLGILVLAAPSGLGLALFANGGLVAKVGFTLQCIVWFLITLKAFLLAKSKKFQEHVSWTLRSYAVTLAAMSLRLSSYLMYYFLHTKPIETYLTVVWTSWVLNLILIEIAIQLGLDKYLFRKIFPTINQL